MKIKKENILVIIPAYNEMDSIMATVRSVMSSGYSYIVVNDGSTDATLDICRENRFNVLNLPHNLGIGGAVQAGHKYALRNNYLVDIQVDGDGQHDPSFIWGLVKEIEDGADLVIGSRFLKNDQGFRSTPLRRIGINWIKTLIHLLTGAKVTDPTSGFRACGVKAIKMFSEEYPSDYPEPESIVSALENGLDVRELPVVMNERQGGVSSISGFSSIYYMITVTLAIIIEKIYKK